MTLKMGRDRGWAGSGCRQGKQGQTPMLWDCTSNSPRQCTCPLDLYSRIRTEQGLLPQTAAATCRRPAAQLNICNRCTATAHPCRLLPHREHLSGIRGVGYGARCPPAAFTICRALSWRSARCAQNSSRRLLRPLFSPSSPPHLSVASPVVLPRLPESDRALESSSPPTSLRVRLQPAHPPPTVATGSSSTRRVPPAGAQQEQRGISTCRPGPPANNRRHERHLGHQRQRAGQPLQSHQPPAVRDPV